jgi:hypothetical protein
MEEILRKLDPKKLKAAKKGGVGLIGDTERDAFKQMEAAQHRIADAWNRIKITVITKLYPIVAKMSEAFADKLEAALPKIQSAMQFIADHMDTIVAAAKVFVAVMTTKKLIGVLGSVPGVGKIAGAVGGKFMQSMGAGMAFGGMGPVSAALGALKASLITLGPVIALVVAAIALVYLGFQAFQKNLHGIGDSIRKHVASIVARFEILWGFLSSLGSAVAKLFGGDGGGLMDVLGYIAAFSFDTILAGFDLWLHHIQTVVSMMVELVDLITPLWKEYVQDPFMESMHAIASGVGKVVNFLIDQYNLIVGFWGGQAKEHMGAGLFDWAKPVVGALKTGAAFYMKHADKTQRETERQMRWDAMEEGKKNKKRAGEDAKPPGNQMNFPGARFDITQNFAEGFDPDRIAVAFGNDLASLGEMKSQSGFANVYAAR